MANSTIINLVIVFLLFHTIHATNNAIARTKFSAFSKEKLPFVRVQFDIEKDEYLELHEKLINATRQNTNIEAKGVKVLPNQSGTKNQPPAWILLDLATRHGVTTIALRSDNLYLVAFTNSKGDCYIFPPNDKLLERCNPLSFEETYKSMLGEDFEYPDLGNQVLSKEIAIEAVGILLNYDDNYDDPFTLADSELKIPLVKLILTLCEASRFKDISSTIASGWDTESHITNPSRVRHWSTVSRGLIIGWIDDVGKGAGEDAGEGAGQLIIKDRADFNTIRDIFHLDNKDDYPSLFHVLICPTGHKCNLA